MVRGTLHSLRGSDPGAPRAAAARRVSPHVRGTCTLCWGPGAGRGRGCYPRRQKTGDLSSDGHRHLRACLTRRLTQRQCTPDGESLPRQHNGPGWGLPEKTRPRHGFLGWHFSNFDYLTQMELNEFT